MFLPKNLRENVAEIKISLEKRGESSSSIDQAIKLDEERREIIAEVEQLEHRRNTESVQIGELKAAGEESKAEGLIEEMARIKQQIQQLNDQLGELDRQLEDILLRIPNILDESVPIGADNSENRLEKQVGEPFKADFDPLPHWELGTARGLLDLERAQKISGSRFSVLPGKGARLERALINFMLDIQSGENGYQEIMTPVLVKPEAMEGTGQLPKFAADMYRTTDDGLYLIPTAEVSLLNLYREEILSPDVLPLKLTGWTPCFRREAGAHGKDTRGIMRQHQFNKVELVAICRPEESEELHNDLLGDACSILNRLELPYRIVTLCSGDTGFSAAKTYDIEVWIPSQNRYREISSCSNCTAFQARRAMIQYRPAPGEKARYCHTLNGSGIAVGRCWLALIENYQEKTGEITVPDALRPYLDGLKKL